MYTINLKHSNMKKIYFLFTFFISTLAMSQTNYPGNGKMGFLGAVGMGSISVSDNLTTVTFVLNRGMGNFTNSLVIYIDSKAGGFSTTSGFTD